LSLISKQAANLATKFALALTIIKHPDAEELARASAALLVKTEELVGVGI